MPLIQVKDDTKRNLNWGKVHLCPVMIGISWGFLVQSEFWILSQASAASLLVTDPLVSGCRGLWVFSPRGVYSTLLGVGVGGRVGSQFDWRVCNVFTNINITCTLIDLFSVIYFPLILAQLHYLWQLATKLCLQTWPWCSGTSPNFLEKTFTVVGLVPWIFSRKIQCL